MGPSCRYLEYRHLNGGEESCNSLAQINGIVDYWLVPITFGVAILTSCIMQDFVARGVEDQGEARIAWFTGGAATLVTGIWCALYLCLLGLERPVPGYDQLFFATLTTLAMTFGSLPALSMFRRERTKRFRVGTAVDLRTLSADAGPLDHDQLGLGPARRSFAILRARDAIGDRNHRARDLDVKGSGVSDLDQTHEALGETDQKYRSMFDEALVGIFTLDPNGRIISVNPAMAESLGYANPKEILAEMTEPLWTLAVSPERRAEFMAKMETAGHVKSFEVEIYRRDGSKIWISCSVRAKYNDHSLVGFIGMFEDISERRHLREQLLQAQKLESVGQLAAGIAHEINTPVQYIGDNIRFLKETFDELLNLIVEYQSAVSGASDEELSPQMLSKLLKVSAKANIDYLAAEIPKAIDQTLEGISRVSALVGAMKEFSHPGNGNKVLLDLNHAIKSTVTVARNEWKYVADVKLELDPDIPAVSCLPEESNQVILNLIVNAAHAITDVVSGKAVEKGLITIRTRSLATGVEIQIEDTGCGIPDKVRSRVFDPFFTTKEIGKELVRG